LDAQARAGLHQGLLNEKGSLFASHPTFKERVDAVAELPKAAHPEEGRALDLFDGVEGLEKELTEFMTGYVYHVRQLQARAAAEQ
jgi:hypothetical protein